MDQAAAQARVKQLVEMAMRAPETEEGRNAAIAAWKLVRQSGLLLIRSDELVTFVTQPLAPAPATKKRRRSKKPAEILDAATEGVVTTVNAATRVASSLTAFRDAIRGR